MGELPQRVSPMRTLARQHSKRLLADFIVGAHASLCADRLLTLDFRVQSAAFSRLAG
jgi:hypothetical protein